jgi:Spy/CpxP family protein refolding chaperone
MMEHGSRTKLVTAIVLALVFGSGVLLGYAADSNLFPSAEVAAAAEAADGADAGQARRRGYVYEQMARTPEQDSAIDHIIRSHRDLMNQLHRDFDAAQIEYEANFDALVSETREAIALVFRPEQRAEYRHLLAEFDERREADRAARDDRK